MRRCVFPFLLLLMIMLAGCKLGQNADSSDVAVSPKTAYSSDTSAEDCYLCGGGIENLIPSYWGQNNIALISLNTFEIKPLEINRYDRLDGRLIEEYSGAVSLIVGNNDGGFSASLIQDSDRGYATGHVDFYNDELLDVSKAAGFLCESCLNKILPSQIDRYFGVGVINLATREVRAFEKHLVGFGLGDFYIDCDLKDRDGNTHRMDLLIFYCPYGLQRSHNLALVFPRGCAGMSDQRERESHAVRRVRPGALRQVRGFWAPNKRIRIPKGYSDALLARVIRNFRNRNFCFIGTNVRHR